MQNSISPECPPSASDAGEVLIRDPTEPFLGDSVTTGDELHASTSTQLECVSEYLSTDQVISPARAIFVRTLALLCACSLSIGSH